MAEEGQTPQQPEGKPAEIPKLVLTIKDKNVLYTVYMGFLQDGGIFIPTNKPFKLGQQVQMHLGLMNEKDKYPVIGKVVWITPKGAQGNRAPGIGVQFNGEAGIVVRSKIETYLAGIQSSEKQTHTL